MQKIVVVQWASDAASDGWVEYFWRCGKLQMRCLQNALLPLSDVTVVEMFPVRASDVVWSFRRPRNRWVCMRYAAMRCGAVRESGCGENVGYSGRDPPSVEKRGGGRHQSESGVANVAAGRPD